MLKNRLKIIHLKLNLPTCMILRLKRPSIKYVWTITLDMHGDIVQPIQQLAHFEWARHLRNNEIKVKLVI